MNSKFFQPGKPRIFAHRGDSRRAPENSLKAFEWGLKHSPYVETDLHSLKDGTLVFHHDVDLVRSCGVQKRLSEITLDELKKYKLFGSSESIPLASEALMAFPQALWNIEIKDPRLGIEHDVFSLLKKFDACDRTLIAAEQDSIMERFRALDTGIPTSAAHNEMLAIVQWMMGGAQGDWKISADAFQLPTEFSGIKLDRPELIEVAHRLGVEVHYWTINDPSLARQLVANGADGIVTDDPELMKKTFS